MALTTKLEIRQGQQLVMTPQLQQAIRLLQLSNLELSAFVETEMERNPLLERDDASDSGDDRGLPDAGDIDGSQGEGEERSFDAADVIGGGDVAQGSEAVDADVAALYPDASSAEISAGEVRDDGPSQGDGLMWSNTRNTTSSFDGSEGLDVEAFGAESLSLRDHLLQQAGIAFPAAADRLVASHLIDLVDDAGYMRESLADVAEKLGTEVGHVERVLGRLQTFEPSGVCARTLQECLAIQLRDQNRYDEVIGRLIDNLHLVAQNNLPALRKIVRVDDDELREMIAELRALNPKPGLAFGSAPVQAVVPDVFVRPSRDGGWSVELNAETLPRVLVNRSYYTLVTKASCTEKDKTYLADCLQSANWLVKSLDQRARTILRVAEEIVRQQDAFLTHGVQHLRPLNLKTVADKIKMHESTVSRVTSNKYVATPRGLFELKYFFTSSIASADAGETAHSSEAVRHRIKSMIDAESPTDILSDDKIVERLKSDGVDIARRTVAKYRESMRISSSVQRRREKQLARQLGAADKLTA